MKTFAPAILAAAATCAMLAVPVPARAEAPFTTDFRLESCTFDAEEGNAYFSLDPGHRLVLEGDDDGETVTVQITVLEARRSIVFDTSRGKRIRVRTRVVEEREWVDDELVEVSRNFFAACRETGDVYYFGEDVDIYEDGEIVSHEGAWRAGLDGALPGLIMPATYLLGSRYFQEVAPGVALDRARHTAMGLTIATPAGTFRDCVEVTESSPLDAGATSVKRYCPGVGLTVDSSVTLVEVEDDDD